MSTVINERDKLLQAASARLAVVTSSISAWLTNEAHTVPADSAGAVTSYAGATGDFKVYGNGVDISANFTLSTQANPQALTVGYVGRTYTVTAGLDAGEDNALLTIRATGNAGTVYAGLTIDKVFSLGKSRTGATGATGAAAITAFLTNEAHTLPADAAGTVSSYAGATGSFKVYAGSTDVSNLFALSTQANPQALTVGYVSQDYTVTAGFDAGEATASLTIRATGSGAYSGVTIDKVFSLAKSPAGADGANGSNGSNGTNGADGTAYWVVSDAAAVQKSVAGAYTPAAINVTLMRAIGAGAPAAYSGRFIIATTPDGTTYTDQYTSAGDESSKSYTVPASIKAIRVRGYLAGGTTTLLDEQIVPIVADGATGATGSTGSTGTRGSVTAQGSGTVWSDATADAAINTFTGAALKVNGDIVTISGTGFAESRYWNGTAWVSYAQKFAGDVIVQGTLTTDRLVANAATAASMVAQTFTNELLASGTFADSAVTTWANFSSTGAPVKIIGWAEILAGQSNTLNESMLSSVAFVEVTVNLAIDSTALASTASYVPTVHAGPSTNPANGRKLRVVVPIVWRVTPTAGSHAYKVWARLSYFDSAGVAVSSPARIVIYGSMVLEENKV